MHQAEEDLLVIAAQDGNQKAFRLLYDRYHRQLLRFAYQISRDQEIAQDAVQECWIKSANTIRKLNDPRAFRSWLYQMVKWRTTDLLRAVSRQLKDGEAFDEAQHSNGDDNIDDEKEELNAAINRLPSLEKQMITLFYLDELSIAEIAQILEIPAGTVKSRLNRARDLLKQKYDC